MNGKVPPHAINLEELVLGACLLEQEAINVVYPIISENTFYEPKNQMIYRAICNLTKSGVRADMGMICQELKKMDYLEKVGGVYYISTLTNKIASSANIEMHARILVEYELKRKLIVRSITFQESLFNENSDVFELIGSEIQAMFELTNFKSSNQTKHIGDVHSSSIIQMREVIDSGLPSGIPSGIDYLDKLTNGWQKTDLIILAARPSMGKTAEALQFIKHPALNLKKPVALFSLEMSSKQIMGRLQASESHINVSKITTSNVDMNELNAIARDCIKLSEAPIYIDDTPALSLFEFRKKAKRLVIDMKVELIVIDYLQLMTVDGGKGNREQEISLISRGIKQTAKELNIPIIALSQLSRSVETRGGDKKPMLSDLRESGAIEQDADMVIFLYRPEYYGMTDNYQYHSHSLESRNLLINIIAKNRNGALGEIPSKFNGAVMRIDNYRIGEEPKHDF
ncbi:Replicative DNA helicase [Gammaproteobacteria bacterium]